MRNFVVALMFLFLAGCAGKSNPFVGSWQIGAMNDSGVSKPTPNMLEISNGGMVEGNCSSNYIANDGRFYFTNAKVTDSASCPFLSRIVVQDVTAYALAQNHMIINANSANGDYITIIGGRN